jgi:hypothetical protein
MSDEERSVWSKRAEEAARQALDEIQDDIDAIPALSLALACLRAEVGELPADEIEELDEGYREPSCICPPDLLERGGFRGSCPVHSALG